MYVLFLAPLVRVSCNSLYSSPLAGRLLGATPRSQPEHCGIARRRLPADETRQDNEEMATDPEPCDHLPGLS